MLSHHPAANRHDLEAGLAGSACHGPHKPLRRRSSPFITPRLAGLIWRSPRKCLQKPEDIYGQQYNVEDQDRFNPGAVAIENESDVARDCQRPKWNQPFHAEGGQHEPGREKS
jgi:hypothetical protein